MATLTLASAARELLLLRYWQPALGFKKKMDQSFDDRDSISSTSFEMGSAAMEELLFALLSLGSKTAKSSRLGGDVAIGVHFGRAMLHLDRAGFRFLQCSSLFSVVVAACRAVDPGFQVPCCAEHGLERSTSQHLVSLHLEHRVWQAIAAGRLPPFLLLQMVPGLVDSETGLFDASELCRLVGVATLAGQVDIALILSRLPCVSDREGMDQLLQQEALDPDQWRDHLPMTTELTCLVERSLVHPLLDFRSITRCINWIHRFASHHYNQARLEDGQTWLRRHCAVEVSEPGVDFGRARTQQRPAKETKLARDTIKALSALVHNRSRFNPRRHFERKQPPRRFYKLLQ
jgi:hypothetical protein